MGIAKRMATYIEEADQQDADFAISVLVANWSVGNTAVEVATDDIDQCIEEGSDTDIGDGYTRIY